MSGADVGLATDLTTALSTELARWEEHGRPALPVDGFVLDRPDGRARRGVYRSDGTLVAEPAGHLHRITPSPDGSLIAVEWAEDADERAVLALLSTDTGEMRLHPDIRMRYDAVLWAADSRRLEVVAGRDQLIVDLDVQSGEMRTTPIDPASRVRLFPGGRRGLLAQRGATGPTLLVDRATGAEIGRYAALYRAMPHRDGILVWGDAGLEVSGLDGAVRWQWADPLATVVDVAVLPERVVVLAVRDGRSVLFAVEEGAVVQCRAVAAGDGAVDDVSATGIVRDGDVLRVAIEGPVSPPRTVACDPRTLQIAPEALLPALPDAVTTRHEIRTDDGELVVVHVTAPADRCGPLPLLLACYGGFGVPFLPVFEPTIPAWLAHGGAWATVQLRGGGERGAAWRAAGHGAGKQRTVDDLAAAARGLVRLGITTPRQLVLVGASLGGTVATSCAYRHPTLCAGVVATAAPLDLLRLDTHPLGGRWKAEFGDDGTPEGRARVRAISPLALAHALTPGGAAPAFLGIVLQKDSRVDGADARRMVSTLRRAGVAARHWTAPDAGHGGNDLTALHGLGLAVLEFAAALTQGPIG